MRFIDSIEPAGEAECVCIQVAAADSLYVTDDFLVTHNTLNDAFIILDEAQNTSPEQMKMFLTRLGFGSKMVVTGDVTQVDLPVGHPSGLRVVQDILDGIDDVNFSLLNRPRRRTPPPGQRHRRRLRPVRTQETRHVRRGAAVPASEAAGDRRSTPDEPPMTIDVNDESGEDVDAPRLAALARFVLDRLKVHPLAELSVLAVDTATMANLHEQWMDEPARPTCCRSRWTSCVRAPDDRDPEPGLLGDVVLCPAVARTQAAAAGHSKDEELDLLHARHPAPARLRPRRARRGARDVRPAAQAPRRLAGAPATILFMSVIDIWLLVVAARSPRPGGRSVQQRGRRAVRRSPRPGPWRSRPEGTSGAPSGSS